MSQEENTVRNKESEPANSRFGFLVNGGDGGIRTLDLTDANRTLSQLSYAPKFTILGNFCYLILRGEIVWCRACAADSLRSQLSYGPKSVQRSGCDLRQSQRHPAPGQTKAVGQNPTLKYYSIIQAVVKRFFKKTEK